MQQYREKNKSDEDDIKSAENQHHNTVFKTWPKYGLNVIKRLMKIWQGCTIKQLALVINKIMKNMSMPRHTYYSTM